MLYVQDDIEAASHTMRNGGSFLQWTSAFATTIDESAWFILLFLFELETWVLSDEIQERPAVQRLVRLIRIICYVSLAHSIWAFSDIYLDLTRVAAEPHISKLCQLANTDISFVRNLEYTSLNSENCQSLSTQSEFFYTEPGLVVSDGAGFSLEKNLALVDFLEVAFWLLILLTIEVMVRLQDRAVTRGTLVSSIKISKWFLYSGLWLMAGYWLYLGHFHFAWDEALWIVGFLAIETNVSRWKKEIELTQSP